MNLHKYFSIFCVLAVFLSGCASQRKQPMPHVSSGVDESYEEALGLYDVEDTSPRVRDPLEKFNRAMFTVNDALFLNFVRPVAKGYGAVIPESVRNNISNAYNNVGYPGRAVNSLLQGKVDKVGQETEAFVVNSVLGVGGLFKAYESLGNTPVSPEDTDQTLAVWGIDEGVYLFIPLLGPTTLRGIAGRVGDSALYPISYIEKDLLRIGLGVEERVNALSFRVDDIDSFNKSALDPYSAWKDAYLQRIQKIVEE